MDDSQRPQGTLSRIANFFTGNSSASKTLSKWKQSGEQEEWSAKAIDTLVKKLKKKQNGIKNLEDALKSRSETSKCVTIPRSIDGRLQVKKRLKYLFSMVIWAPYFNIPMSNLFYSLIRVIIFMNLSGFKL